MGYQVVGCSRKPAELGHKSYRHFEVDVGDESGVQQMFGEVRKEYGRLDVLINNAGVAALVDDGSDRYVLG